MKTALIQFADKQKEYISGIMTSATHYLNTSVREEMNNNNNIREIKRITCGCRDNDDFS